MRGLIFTEFLDHVEQHYNFEVVDQIITQLGGDLSTGGAYTAVGNYPHEELLALAVALCGVTGSAKTVVLRDFAGKLMDTFRLMHPEYFEATDDVFAFLMSVESLIHVDVRKLYPDANPPLVAGSILNDGEMLLHYRSHRPLAELALALTEVSAREFGQALNIEVIERDADDRSLKIRLSKVP